MDNHIRKFFEDKDGQLVLWQRPNVPLIGWAFFLILAKFISNGWWHSAARYLSLASLLIWALLEIIWGASYFRRTLGVAVLVFSIVARF